MALWTPALLLRSEASEILPFLKANKTASTVLGRLAEDMTLWSRRAEILLPTAFMSVRQTRFHRVKQRAFLPWNSRGLVGQDSVGFLRQDWAPWEAKDRNKAPIGLLSTRKWDEEKMPRCPRPKV